MKLFRIIFPKTAKAAMAGLLLSVLFSCGKEEAQEVPVPQEPQASITMLTYLVNISPGEEAYVDFRINPYETKFDYDVEGGKCAISLADQYGGQGADLNCTITRIEPLGSDYNDKGKYRVWLSNARRKHTFENKFILVYTDGKGRKAKSAAFTVKSECDELTASVLATGLPLVRIETVDHEEPTCEYVSHPPGCNGAGIKNPTKVPGTVAVLSGDEIKYSGSMTVRIRGNTSAYQPKKPYKIKLEKKGDMLFRGDDSKYKDKNWILLRYDGLNTLAGLRVNKLLGMQWTPSFIFVNVVFNGDYRGLYMLIEQVRRNEDCRLKVSENGFVLEFDAYWWNEDVYFSGGWNYSQQYTFKYPEDDEVTPEQKAYITQYVKEAESAIRHGTYPDYIDVTSFAKWLLGHEILGNLDCAGSNLFLTKGDNTPYSKLMMANLWDFDNIYRMTGNWANIHVWGAFYYPALLSNSNPEFLDTFVTLWTNNYSKSICQSMSSFMTSYASSAEAKALDASIVLDNQRWRSGHTTVAKSCKNAKDWFDSRYEWLNTQIPALKQ